jgi:transposase-like protein
LTLHRGIEDHRDLLPAVGTREEVLHMTCKKCKTPMKELKGHIYHKKRKWKCAKCGRARMQSQK